MYTENSSVKSTQGEWIMGRKKEGKKKGYIHIVGSMNAESYYTDLYIDTVRQNNK